MAYRDTRMAFGRRGPSVTVDAPRPDKVRGGALGPDGLLPPGPVVVALDGPVSPASVERAGCLLAGRPDVAVDISNVSELGFLADLPPVADLTISAAQVRLADIGGLAAQAMSLRQLILWLPPGPRPALDPLAELSGLTALYLEGVGRSTRGLESALPRLRALRHLVLHSVTLRRPELLGSSPELVGLALKLGGNRDLGALVDLPCLRFLELWMVRMLTDLTPLSRCATLEVLALQDLPHVEIPDMAGTALAHLRSENVPLRRGIAGLAGAPLRQVTIYGSTLTLDGLAPLRGHPTLEAARVLLPGVDDDESSLGLPAPHDAPFVCFGAGVMGLPPTGWDGVYDT